MRTTLLWTCLAVVGPAKAQLINGSFEDGLNGWLWFPADFSGEAIVASEAAPGEGTQCLSVNTVHYLANSPNAVAQVLPMAEPGATLHFSGWMSSSFGYDTPPSFGPALCDSTGLISTTGIQFYLGIQLGSWQFNEGTITLASSPPAGSWCGLVLQGGRHQAWFQVPTLFDGFTAYAELNTGLDPLAGGSPAFRPNPATDKLWVDLSEAPTSINAIDATGRSYALQQVQHSGRTLELDVSALPSGICMLRIMTPSGTRTVRFIKN